LKRVHIWKFDSDEEEYKQGKINCSENIFLFFRVSLDENEKRIGKKVNRRRNLKGRRAIKINKVGRN